MPTASLRLFAIRLRHSIIFGLGAALLSAGCRDDAQAPASRPEAPPEPAATGELAPLDLVYVCGNKFLATNATRSRVTVTYRVTGTNESGSLTLPEEPGEEPGYSESELETTERGAVELYLDGDMVARRGNAGLPCGPSAPSLAAAQTSSTEPLGQWSPPFVWNNIAVHLSLLPTGKVLAFGLSGTAQVWDPATGSFTAAPSPAVIFCAGHSLLADGRLLVAGGNNHPTEALNGIPDITIFDPWTESWSRSTPMRRGRWYPTTTVLGDGAVVILAGKDASGIHVNEPEVWSDGTLRQLTTAKLKLPLYPRMFLAPDGRLFMAGENARTRYLNPSGAGTWTLGPARRYGRRDYGAAVMYDAGKILYVGGGLTTNTAEIINLNAATPRWRWTGSMAYPRRHLNAVVLPTGEVLVTGGSRGTVFNDYKRPVYAAELWNPATGLWTTLAANAVPRVYHSTSLLLPDGRVLHTGSGDAGPDQRNAELFSPPYLFNGARPEITQVPDSVGYGTRFSVATPQAAAITKVSLVRLGSTTHAFDMNQRFQWLSFTRQDGALDVSMPGNPNRTPPGHYMLFVLDGSGVPSVGRTIWVGSRALAGTFIAPSNGPI
jgi:Domain of unknown function (DUF1929)/Glyoxal oxidase N-terminus